MKIQPAVRTETVRIAMGTAFFSLVMLLVFALLDRLDVTVVLGTLLGAGAAVLNFFLMALDTVDKSVVLWYNEEKRTGVFLHGEQLSTARYVRCDVGNSQAVHNRKQGNVGRERKGYPSISEWRVLDFENGSTMERPAAGIW